jgi:hypothetical protein
VQHGEQGQLLLLDLLLLLLVEEALLPRLVVGYS